MFWADFGGVDAVRCGVKRSRLAGFGDSRTDDLTSDLTRVFLGVTTVFCGFGGFFFAAASLVTVIETGVALLLMRGGFGLTTEGSDFEGALLGVDALR